MGKKEICKRLVRGLIFVGLLFSMLCCFKRVFSIKTGDGILSMQKFYEQEEDTVDVLVIGSSHAFTDINTAVLWENHGIASYILGGAQQPLWNSYYCLEEALKTQTPKLIVLEAYMTTFSGDYLESNYIISNTYGMKWSKTKFDAISASVPEENRMEYLLDYVQYHSRYNDISSIDFVKDQGERKYENWKGYVCQTGIKGFSTVEVTGTTERRPMSEKSELYFRRIIELAQEKEIPICVIVSPYPVISQTEEEIYNYVSDICMEYGVNYRNYNYEFEEMGIDLATDYCDEVHLNDVGGVKFTRLLGEYLKDNYEIPDRRGDAKWVSWSEDANCIEHCLMVKRFNNLGNTKNTLKAIDENGYVAFISLSGTATDATKEELAALKGINVEDLTDLQMGMYQDGKIKSSITDMGIGKDVFEFDERTVIFSREVDEDGTIENMISVDAAKGNIVKNGYNIIVYDEVLGDVINVFGIESSDPSVCYR